MDSILVDQIAFSERLFTSVRNKDINYQIAVKQRKEIARRISINSIIQERKEKHLNTDYIEKR